MYIQFDPGHLLDSSFKHYYHTVLANKHQATSATTKQEKSNPVFYRKQNVYSSCISLSSSLICRWSDQRIVWNTGLLQWYRLSLYCRLFEETEDFSDHYHLWPVWRFEDLSFLEILEFSAQNWLKPSPIISISMFTLLIIIPRPTLLSTISSLWRIFLFLFLCLFPRPLANFMLLTKRLNRSSTCKLWIWTPSSISCVMLTAKRILKASEVNSLVIFINSFIICFIWVAILFWWYLVSIDSSLCIRCSNQTMKKLMILYTPIYHSINLFIELNT